MLTDAVLEAVKLIRRADSLIITAGAGMGVDSGLRDFRGDKGFWQAYPALHKSGLRFHEIANPEYFKTQPELAWGFYGHRLKLYRETTPHHGFAILSKLADAMPYGAFVFTSNVDGQFQKAGFDEDRIIECHGSIHHLQCASNCTKHVWPAERIQPEIDEVNCLLTSPLPCCMFCLEIARPNILIFNDFDWLPDRKYEQQMKYREWRSRATNPVVIELGAGTAIPSVRIFGQDQGAPMIRINPREADFSNAISGQVPLPMGALEALNAIDELIH